MKKLCPTLLLALVAGFFNCVYAMEDGHVLKEQWAKYDAARKADRPVKEAEILSEIKVEAIRRHLPVDFYDAATQYVHTEERRDWKKGIELSRGLAKEVEEFGDPFITYLWMCDWGNALLSTKWKHVKDNPKGFEGCHPSLYSGVDSYLGGTLKPFIKSDAEFVLWHLLAFRPPMEAEGAEIVASLRKMLGGSYPGDFALDYALLSRKDYPSERLEEKKKALEALIGQCPGKAAALYPEADILNIKMKELDKAGASGEEYRSLGDACRGFEKRREAFRGDEAVIAKGCTGVKTLLDRLTSKDLWVETEPGKIRVLFRNLGIADVTLRSDGRTVKSWKAVNKAGSYYVRDTVELALGPLPDGSYSIEAVNGKISAHGTLDQYTFSIATRLEAGGHSIYVADYKTGEPLRNVTLRLLKGDKELAVSTLALKGFTRIPDAFAKQIESVGKRAYLSVEAVSGDRRSKPVSLNRGSYYDGTGSRRYCNIYKDRGAYQPGDTVHFKAIVYEGNPMLRLGVCKGEKLEITLVDSEDNKLETKKLVTNDWGSVSGEFVIPTGLRNGRFSLVVKNLASDSFRVEEYVLPSFDLTFDKPEGLLRPGTEVPVTGRVTSYSGHSLAGARALLEVNSFNRTVHTEEKALEADGSFAFTFIPDSYGYFDATVSVTDASGETLSFQNDYFLVNQVFIETSVASAVEARVRLFSDDNENRRWSWKEADVIETREFRADIKVRWSVDEYIPLPVSCVLTDVDGKTLYSKVLEPGKALETKLPGSGLYTLKTSVSLEVDGKEEVFSEEDKILCILPGETKVPRGVKSVMLKGSTEVGPSGEISARLGSGEGKAYVQVTLFGEKGKTLESRQVVIEDGSIGNITVPYAGSYPDAVKLQLFYFIDGEDVHYDLDYRRAKNKLTLPLKFTRFHDKALPGTEYSFELSTSPGVEALAAAWDKSLDAIDTNDWSTVSLRDYSVDYIPLRTECGGISGFSDLPVLYAERAMTKSSNARVVDYGDDAIIEEEVVGVEGPVDEEPIRLRTDFSTALTFQPHLISSKDGKLRFSFRTSDKLSTFYVRVLAHDGDMRNALSEGEMVVSLPVKVSILEPRFLYEGDRYEAVVTVSSVADEPVSGTLVFRAGDSVQQLPLTVGPGKTVSRSFTVIPHCDSSVIPSPEGASVSLTASFKAPDFSDGIEVKVPVYPAAQVLTEAHSAVLRDGMSRDALLEELGSRFVNVPASAANIKEISVLDMVKDAIPSHVVPSGMDILSLSEAWYIGLMASRLNPSESPDVSPLLEKILACRNADGGFAWFEGMPSSPVITAVLLERFAKLYERDFDTPDTWESVEYLDKVQFGTDVPYWCGRVSDAQYMRVRSLYPEVPFEVKAVSQAQKKRLQEFKKYAKSYLVPSARESRGLEGQILAKARRLLTLRALNDSEEGRKLAADWGIKLATSSRLKSSIKADVTSLLEYAVEHRDGGWYYPNAVMPWRGLLESEAYAHALLCELLSPSPVADGIRLWLMLQKETQHWDAEPAFIDAITAVLDGSEAVLNTRILALSATYEAPFKEIKAAGNGFTVERKFYRNGVEIEPGTQLSVGDRITVKYDIWNAENRSFVRLTAGREASLQPVQQLSGHIGYGFIRPFRSGVIWGFTPHGYRNVKAAATEFYFDSYPEEKTSLEEEFFVVRAGTFQAPVTVIESLYASHYRANSGYLPPMLSASR